MGCNAREVKRMQSGTGEQGLQRVQLMRDSGGCVTSRNAQGCALLPAVPQTSQLERIQRFVTLVPGAGCRQPVTRVSQCRPARSPHASEERNMARNRSTGPRSLNGVHFYTITCVLLAPVLEYCIRGKDAVEGRVPGERQTPCRWQARKLRILRRRGQRRHLRTLCHRKTA